VVPIIIGALGSVSVDLPSYMESLNLPFYLIAIFQRTVLFRTSISSILRRYLQISFCIFCSWLELRFFFIPVLMYISGMYIFY